MYKASQKMVVSEAHRGMTVGAQPTVIVPTLPRRGALIKVCYAGACPGERSHSRHSSHPNLPGYEIAGILQSMSEEVPNSNNYNIGDKVILYPDEELSKSGLSELIAIDNVNNLIQIPKNISLEVASMLPGAALTAYSVVYKAKAYIEDKLKEKRSVNVLVVGAGIKGLWTLQVAAWLMKGFDSNRLLINIADGHIERLMCARDSGCSEIIHWNEEDHEQYIIERTRDACRGGVDVVIDFIGSQRTVSRAVSVLNKGGIVLFGGDELSEVNINLRSLTENQQSLLGIQKGSIEQLKELVNAVSANELKPPHYSVYNIDEATQVFDDLNQNRIVGRAILRYGNANQSTNANTNHNYTTQMDITDN